MLLLIALQLVAGGGGVSEPERVLEKVESHCGKGQLLPRYNSSVDDDDDKKCWRLQGRSQGIWGRGGVFNIMQYYWRIYQYCVSMHENR